MQEDPSGSEEPLPEKLNVEMKGEVPEPVPEAEKPFDVSALKLKIAERVRSDSKDKGALTPQHVVEELAQGLPQERLAPLLTEMSTEGQFGDMKAIVAPSGRIYLFSEKHLIAVEAQQKGRVEEAKFEVVEKIRSDSANIQLTPGTDIDKLLEWADPAEKESILKAVETQEQFKDIKKMTGSNGVVYYHSDKYMSGRYGMVMLRAKTFAPAYGIAEFVREQSKIQSMPPKIDHFRDPVFGIDPTKLETVIDEMLKHPDYQDIKKLVHPETKGVFLYSTKWLSDDAAFSAVDWEEVKRLKYP